MNQKDGGQAVTSADDMKPGLIAIPRPKGSPFPDALSPDVLQFMSELKENNHRDFMRLNEVTSYGDSNTYAHVHAIIRIRNDGILFARTLSTLLVW